QPLDGLPGLSFLEETLPGPCHGSSFQVASPPMTPETQHMLTMLKTAMRILGFSNRDVERKLGLSSSYLSRLFSGLIELKFQHIVDIARAIGMEPEEMLYLAYPQPKYPPSEAAVRMRSLVGGAQPLVAQAPAPAA